MTSVFTTPEKLEPPPGRFWLAVRAFHIAWPVVHGLLPRPDPLGRYRMRRAAKRLVPLKTWPGMNATSAQVAQLAMMRLLFLQRQTRRAVRGRHREASVMLARSSVETLILGLYCMREPRAAAKLNAGNVKAAADSLAYVGDTGFVPESVIRECVVRLGAPAKAHLGVWEMVKVIDDANGNKAGGAIYRRFYVPLSNFTVHAGSGTLLRHVRRHGRLRYRPARAWFRRSPARVADAAAGYLAADLARRAGVLDDKLVRYADRHMTRALLPMFFIGLTGLGGQAVKLRFREATRRARDLYVYLWTGPASSQPVAARIAYVRDHFKWFLRFDDPDFPEHTLDPFIDYVAEKFATSVPPAPAESGT